MNVLEKILEEMLNYERVVKNDEDLEWNRAMYKCSEIIRSHMDEATVSKMENVQADGWIPVEERLPEDDNYILLSFSNFSLPLIGRYEADNDGGGAFYLGDDDEGDTCLSEDLYVNAWHSAQTQRNRSRRMRWPLRR